MSKQPDRPYLFTWLAAGWLLLLLVLEFVIAERNPLAAAVSYIPQHPLALPFLPALFAGLFARRWRLLLVNLLLVAVFLTACMGFKVGLPGNRSGDLRVMTLNLHRCAGNPDPLIRIIAREKPDVIFFQEADPIRGREAALRKVLGAGGGRWHTAKVADVAILSRRPLSGVRSYALLPGLGRRVLVAETEAGGRKITVACAHFATNTAHASQRHMAAYLRGSAKSRTSQVGVLLNNLPANNTIVAGDFNLPPRGLAYGRITRQYVDTFAAGAGFGYTYRADAPIMRIDHVFTGRDMTPTRWRAIDTGFSDHKAVIVDIAFARQASPAP
jgi:vancomycin resistance protein VanJ